MPRPSPAAANKLRLAWKTTIPDHAISLAWSPDGKHLAAAAVTGAVAVLDANTGKPQHTLSGHGFGTTAVAWHPAGRVLATAGQDGKARLWDSLIGPEVQSLDGGAAWVEQLAWSPDGQFIATAAGKKARLWDSAGKLLREYPAQAGTITDLAWRPRSNQLTVLAYGAATLFDPGSDTPARVFAWKGSPLRLAWSPDGKILAHGNQDSTVHFWYAVTGHDLQMSGYPSKVRELSWDFTSRFLATGGGSMVCVWDCGGVSGPEGTKPQMFEGHTENLTAVAFQSRGYLLASAGADGRVFLWQPANKKTPKVGEFRFNEVEASVMVWSPDDKSLAVGSGAGDVAMLRAG